MKNKIYTVSVGIPAHNESGNIKRLLGSLLTQNEEGFILKEIIVISDGSNDGTDQIVANINSKKIRLIIEKERKGKSSRLNQIFKIFRGDILFTLDADILITDKNLFSSILKKSKLNKDALISIRTEPIRGKNFIEKCLHYNTLLKNEYLKNSNSGNTYLGFHGEFMGYWGDFAKTITLNTSLVNDDTYLYFFTKKLGYRPKYISDVNIYYRAPSTFEDYLQQSSRFQSSRKELQKYFANDLKKEYQFPIMLITTSLKYFISNPILFSGYLFFHILARLKKRRDIKSPWKIAFSTKHYD